MKGSVYEYLSVDYSFVVYPEDYQKLCADYNPMAPGAQMWGGGTHLTKQVLKLGLWLRQLWGLGLVYTHTLLCHFDNLFHIFTILFPDL